jgi:multidrug resistance efflux pump
VLFVLDRARYQRPLATAEANVGARQADMENARQQAERRVRLTSLAVSDEARQSALLTASAAADQQAMADRSTAKLIVDRIVIRAPVNGFVTNLMLDIGIGQYAAVGTGVMALIDSDSYRVMGYFKNTKIPAVPPGKQVEIYLMSGGPPLRGHVRALAAALPIAAIPPAPSSSPTSLQPSNGCGWRNAYRCVFTSTISPMAF